MCEEELKEMRKQGFEILICVDIELPKNYGRSGFAVNETMSETKILKDLKDNDPLACTHSELERMV